MATLSKPIVTYVGRVNSRTDKAFDGITEKYMQAYDEYAIGERPICEAKVIKKPRKNK